jgi:enoyl-CoA hydratase/carnithine racemase
MSAIRMERPAAHVARIVIDNPPANSLGRDARRALSRALDEIEADLAVRAVVLAGRGKAFCTGDDLAEAAGRGKAEALESLQDFARLFGQLERLRAPVIAAVNGWAMGGGLELALCCDLRLASGAARFVCSGVNVGLIASAHRLPRLIGLSRAKHMLLTGEPIAAETAERWGLATELVAEADALEARALALAEHIASRAPLAVEAAKRCASQAFDLDAAAADAAFVREASALALTEDHAAALAAFANKGEPEFRRR